MKFIAVSIFIASSLVALFQASPIFEREICIDSIVPCPDECSETCIYPDLPCPKQYTPSCPIDDNEPICIDVIVPCPDECVDTCIYPNKPCPKQYTPHCPRIEDPIFSDRF